MIRLIRNFANSILLLSLAGLEATPAQAAPVWTFVTVPVTGIVSGPPGASIGWGYEISNEDTENWLVVSDINAGVFAHAIVESIFDFPILPPAGSVTVPYDGANGLYELTWDATAPPGFINGGMFLASAQWWSGDPFAEGEFLDFAPDQSAPYTAFATAAVPEPSTGVLAFLGAALLATGRLKRVLHLFAGWSHSAISRFVFCQICFLATQADTCRGAPYVFTSFDFPEAVSTWPTGVNNGGQVVGRYSPGGASFLGFQWEGELFSSFHYPNSLDSPAYGINTNGDIVGTYSLDRTNHAYLKVGSTFSSFDFPDSTYTVATGINDTGAITGGYGGRDGVSRSFVKIGNDFTPIVYPGGVSTWAHGINNRGQVVGSSTLGANSSVGFVLDSGTFYTVLYSGSTVTFAYGINNRGHLVGAYRDAASRDHGFLLAGDAFSTLDFPGSDSTYATGINDDGTIVGYYQVGYAFHGFIASHVPEPSTMSLAVGGLLACLALRLRKTAGQMRI